MPLVPYYLGRPAHFWIAAMSRRGSGRIADNGSGVVCGRIPVQPGATQPKVTGAGAGRLAFAGLPAAWDDPDILNCPTG